jgi:outer membrane lipoprotein SlyB
MKSYYLTFTVAAAAVVLAGCETPYGTPDRTGTGALAGGGIGAVSGAIIGSHSGNAGAGALIGGAIGAITGGLIGHSMDEQDAARLRTQAPQTYARLDQGQPISVADVKALAKANIGDDVIISQIRNSRTVFRLSSTDIIDLHDSGVSDKVIDFMISTPSLYSASTAAQSTTVVAAAPPPAPVETVVVAAPGPGYAWVDGEWVWNGGWVWLSAHWVVAPFPRAVWIHGEWIHGPRGWRHLPGRWR